MSCADHLLQLFLGHMHVSEYPMQCKLRSYSLLENGEDPDQAVPTLRAV